MYIFPKYITLAWVRKQLQSVVKEFKKIPSATGITDFLYVVWDCTPYFHVIVIILVLISKTEYLKPKISII